MTLRLIHRRAWDVDWDVHCLTFSTFRRQRFFLGHHAAGWFLETLAAARRDSPFYLFAYTIMPEHVHIVLMPHEKVKMRRVLWLLKKPMSVKAISWVKCFQPSFLEKMADRQPSGKTVYRFWQRGGGYDRNLRSARDVSQKIGYIHDNPVRRSLVQRAEDWPYSSAAQWITGREGPVQLDMEYLPQLSS